MLKGNVNRSIVVEHSLFVLRMPEIWVCSVVSYINIISCKKGTAVSPPYALKGGVTCIISG